MLLLISGKHGFAIPSSDKVPISRAYDVEGIKPDVSLSGKTIKVSKDGSTWLYLKTGESFDVNLDIGALYLWFKTANLKFDIDGKTETFYDLYLKDHTEIDVGTLEGSPEVVTQANGFVVDTGTTADDITSDVFNILLDVAMEDPDFDWSLLDTTAVVSNNTVSGVEAEATWTAKTESASKVPTLPGGKGDITAEGKIAGVQYESVNMGDYEQPNMASGALALGLIFLAAALA